MQSSKLDETNNKVESNDDESDDEELDRQLQRVFGSEVAGGEANKSKPVEDNKPDEKKPENDVLKDNEPSSPLPPPPIDDFDNAIDNMRVNLASNEESSSGQESSAETEPEPIVPVELPSNEEEYEKADKIILERLSSEMTNPRLATQWSTSQASRKKVSFSHNPTIISLDQAELDSELNEQVPSPPVTTPADETSEKKDKKPTKEMLPLSRLLKYGDGIDKIIIVIGTVIALGSSGIYPVIFYGMGEAAGAFDDLMLLKSDEPNATCSAEHTSYNKVEDSVRNNVRLYLIYGFISLFLNFCYFLLFELVATRIISRIRCKIVEVVLMQEKEFFDKYSVNDVNILMNDKVAIFKQCFNNRAINCFSKFMQGLACILFGLALSWRLALVLLVILPPAVFFSLMAIYVKKVYSKRERLSYQKAEGIAKECLESIRTIVAFGLHYKTIYNYEKLLTLSEKVNIRKEAIYGLFFGLSNGLYLFTFGVGMSFTVYLVRTSQCNADVKSAVSSFFSVVVGEILIMASVSFHIEEYISGMRAGKLIYDFIEENSIEYTEQTKLDTLRGEIVFDDVCYRDQVSDSLVLNHLSFKIPAQKTTALVGLDSQTQQTILSVLRKEIKPDSGTVTIDGENILSLDLKWLRKQTAFITPDAVVFKTSIRENIRLGNYDAVDAKIEPAAKLANAHEFIESNPDKYNAVIGKSRGLEFSSSQKERLSIARGFLKDPRLVLIDEITGASSDNQYEHLVDEALDRLREGRTTLLVTNKLSRIKKADLIMALGDGQIKEMGTADELITKKGFYYDLVRFDRRDSVWIETGQGEQIAKASFDESIESNDDDLEEHSSTLDKYVSKAIELIQFNPSKVFKYQMKLFHHHRPDILWLIIGVVAQLANGVIFPIIVYLFCSVFEIFTWSDEDRKIKASLQSMAIVFILACVNAIVIIISSYSFAIISARMTKRLRLKLFRNLVRQEMAFYDKEENDPETLLNHLSITVPRCKGLTSDILYIACQGLAGLAFTLLYSFSVVPTLTAVHMAFVPAIILASYLINKYNTSLKQILIIEKTSNKIFNDALTNARGVITLECRPYYLNRFKEAAKTTQRRNILILLFSFIYSFLNSIQFFLQLSVFAYGYRLMKDENLKDVDLFRSYCMIAVSMIVIMRLSYMWPGYQKSKKAARIAYSLIERESKIDALNETGLKPIQMLGEVRFENVKFNYPKSSHFKTLNGLNLKVQMNESIALIGSPESGKQAILDLLLRFYDPNDGKILLDNIDIKMLNIIWLRSKIRAVSKFLPLLNVSISENITNGFIVRENIPPFVVTDACMTANINDRIEALPEKYKTVFDVSKFSRTEIIRIAIARAIISRPSLLITDITNFDTEEASGLLVIDAVAKTQQGRTSIIMPGHLRQSSLRNSNKIVVIKDGQVIEQGTHQELLQRQGFYSTLDIYN